MPTAEIECPSGLKLVIRNMKAREFSLLADDGEDAAEKKKAANRRTKKTNPMLGIMQGCTLGVSDVGPYEAYGAKAGDLWVLGPDGDYKPSSGPSTGAIPWPDVLMCDWFYLLMRVRAATWGDDYEFRLRCQDKTCERHKRPFTWAVPLSELEVKELPDASRKRVAAKEVIWEFEIGGRKAKFKLQQWRDTDNTRDLTAIPKKDIFLAQCADRLVYVEGIDVTDWDGLLKWVGNRDLPEVFGATQLYDSVDGGIETNTIAVCPSCGLEFEVAVPFAARSFLLPDQRTPGGKPMGEPTS